MTSTDPQAFPVIHGQGPVGFEVEHCLNVDGAGHGAGHFELMRSWLPAGWLQRRGFQAVDAGQQDGKRKAAAEASSEENSLEGAVANLPAAANAWDSPSPPAVIASDCASSDSGHEACGFDSEDMGKNYEPKEECVAPDSPVPERYRGKPLPKRRSALATSWLYRAQKKQDEEEAWQSWLHSFETGDAVDRPSEKAMPRKMAAVAKAVKEDNKNTTRARPFGDFEVPAGHTSSSLTLVSSRDDSPSSSVLRASKKKRGKEKKQKKAKTSKKAKKSKQRVAASSSQDTASPSSSQDTEHAPKRRRRSALAESFKTKKTRTGISVESESGGSEQLRRQVPDAGKDLCKTWSLSELQAFEEMAAQQVTAADNAALEVEQRLTMSKALPAELRKMVWERAGLLPSTENEEVLKANAERLVKHTFAMVKQVRLAWVQAAVQEDYKKTNIALLPEDKLFHHVMTEKFPEEDRAAWEAAL